MTPEQQKLHDLIIAAGTRYEDIVRSTGAVFDTEGWGLANTNDPLRCGIERNDETARFEGDQEALIYVAEQVLHDADTTDGRHARALTIHLLCNELRGMVWGDAYINTRLGPPVKSYHIQAGHTPSRDESSVMEYPSMTATFGAGPPNPQL